MCLRICGDRILEHQQIGAGDLLQQLFFMTIMNNNNDHDNFNQRKKNLPRKTLLKKFEMIWRTRSACTSMPRMSLTAAR